VGLHEGVKMKWFITLAVVLLLSATGHSIEKKCDSSLQIRQHVEIDTESGLFTEKGEVISDIDSRFCVHQIQNGVTRLRDGKPIKYLEFTNSIHRLQDYDFYVRTGLKVAFSDVDVLDQGPTFTQAKKVCPQLTLGSSKGSWRAPRSRYGVPNEVVWELSAESLLAYFADPDLIEGSLWRGLFWTDSQTQHFGTTHNWALNLSNSQMHRNTWKPRLMGVMCILME